MNRWLARFSFTFFICAGLLVWEIYKCLIGERGVVPEWRIAIYVIAAAMAISLGAMGVRARHKQMEQD